MMLTRSALLWNVGPASKYIFDCKACGAENTINSVIINLTAAIGTLSVKHDGDIIINIIRIKLFHLKEFIQCVGNFHYYMNMCTGIMFNT